MGKIVLVDVSTILHRVRLGTKQQSYGLAILSTIDHLKRTLRADRIICIQDLNGSSYRKALSETYKAHRANKEMTDEEKDKLELMRKWNKNLHLFYPFFESYAVAEAEADDIICTLYTRLKEQGVEVKVATVDKDFLGAIPLEDLYNVNKQRYFTQEDRKGLTRKQFRIFQGILGDITDNIKGIAGEKTSVVLAQNFSSYKAMRDFNGDALNMIGITSHNKRHVINALELIKTEDGWDRLKLSYALTSIFTDTSKYNEQQLAKYLEIENKILEDKEVEYNISEKLEDFLEEVGEMEILNVLEDRV